MIRNWFQVQFGQLNEKLDQLLSRSNKQMAILSDLDAALAAQDSAMTSLEAELGKVESDLATLAANPGTAPDVSAELLRIQSNTSRINAALAAVKAADDSAVPPAPTAQ